MTFRAVVDYRLNPDVMVYASFNRGFKSRRGENISTVLAMKVVSTRPENVVGDFEVRAKSIAAAASAIHPVPGYYYEYKDLQVGVVDQNTNTQKSINAAKATISGLEAELVYAVHRRACL